MSALGQKRTLFTAPLYVRFAPESGHSDYRQVPEADIQSDLAECPLINTLAAWPTILPLIGEVSNTSPSHIALL